MNGNSLLTVQVDFVLVSAALLCLLPVVWAILVIRRRFHDHRNRYKLPFTELRRRPAGESTRVKIADLDEQINDRLFLMLALPVGLAMTVFFIKSHSIGAAIVLLASATLWTLAFQSKLLKLLKERRNYRLGFDGERYVGEELSWLISLGFEIYHDVPFDGFNMDHVLVGRPGVFVIETKARSKPVKEAGGKEYRVTFDGKFLQWPWGAEDKDIEQARNNAATLSKWLTKAVGNPVGVSAIVALPGWWIERTGINKGVQVLNPKEILRVCDSKEVNLNDEMIRRICHQLNQKCRVEIK